MAPTGIEQPQDLTKSTFSTKADDESDPRFPTLADFWDGAAHFAVAVQETGLPMGESDTLAVSLSKPSLLALSLPALSLPDQGSAHELWSYVHASHQSAKVYDSCGDAVAFPGCAVLYRSQDNGHSFTIMHQPQQPPICLFTCAACPCQSEIDHTDQQQYPRVVTKAGKWWMVYEYRARVMLRRSDDGIHWRPPEQIPLSGIWQDWLMDCRAEERIGAHPFVAPNYDCLIGGPPGLFLEGDTLYVFVGLGQNPGSMGCYRGRADGPVSLFRKCSHNPLFTGAESYGPSAASGVEANPYFDFRTISSADLVKIGPRYYMFYEGVRGAGDGDGGDTQFGLGLARSLTEQIDGEWETYAENPLLIEQPGNVGVGHADIVIVDEQTWLYTSLDGVARSRLVLEWK